MSSSLISHPGLLRYGLAILAVALASLLTWLVLPFTGELPIEIFFTAVLLVLWFGRLGPGLLALAIGVLVIDFFFVPPYQAIDFKPRDVLRYGIFSFLALLVYLVGEARDRLMSHLRQTEWEMARAAEVQGRMLPVPPAVPGLDLGARCRPANPTGGDYFDFFVLPGGALGFALGDVSGHGLGPALLAAGLRAYVRALYPACGDAGKALSLANRFVYEDTSDDMFITLFLGSVGPLTRSLSFAGAGHAGYIISERGEVVALESSGPPLGINAFEDYATSFVHHIKDGEVVLILSDGALEAAPPGGGQFGIRRAAEVVCRHRGEPAQNIAAALCQAAEAFVGPGNQLDDLTVIVIKCAPASVEAITPRADQSAFMLS
jgi:hypothetical protein